MTLCFQVHGGCLLENFEELNFFLFLQDITQPPPIIFMFSSPLWCPPWSWSDSQVEGKFDMMNNGTAWTLQTLHTAHSTLHIIHSVLYTIHFTPHTLHSAHLAHTTHNEQTAHTKHTAQCAVHPLFTWLEQKKMSSRQKEANTSHLLAHQWPLAFASNIRGIFYYTYCTWILPCWVDNFPLTANHTGLVFVGILEMISPVSSWSIVLTSALTAVWVQI